MNYSTIKGKRFLRAFGAILCLVVLVWVLPIASANAEDDAPDEVLTMDDIYVCLAGDDGLGELVPMHTVTSIGRENVKVRGVKSKNKLLEYTIPDELLLADGNFAALMMEADKYIGYPYVYGASNPREGFDCSGFVCWVFIHSGVYNSGRRGATGLHTLCNEVDPEDVRPGDLVFFQGTMGPDVKGITHVGIYVGNDMMIHAGDPIGFADLTEPRWQKHFFCYGRLPFEEESEDE